MAIKVAGSNVHLINITREDTPLPLRLQAIASLAIEFAGEGDILDVGCGWGNVAELIRKELPEARIALADAYQECLQEASARIGGSTSTFLVDEDRFDIDVSIWGEYDCILLSHVLEHLRDPIAGVRSLCRKLKPAGVLILAVPNLSRPEVLISNIFQRDTSNPGHVCGWDPSHFRNFLANILGLEIVRLTTDFVGLVPGWPGRIVARVLGRPLASVLPWWGWSVIAIVRPGAAFRKGEIVNGPRSSPRAARLTVSVDQGVASS